MRRGKWLYFCTFCRRWTAERPNQPKCRTCGYPYRLPSPSAPKAREPQRPSTTYFEQTLDRLERDLLSNAFPNGKEYNPDPPDDLPF